MTIAHAAARYALYFTPDPRTDWWQRWTHWLGRDALTGRTCAQPRIAGVDAAEFSELTQAPRQYGLHATLKAPFRLSPGRQIDELERAVNAYCRQQRSFRLPALRLDTLDRFLALTTTFAHAPVERIAADCVQRFDGFRAAPSVQETARRRRAPLSAREIELLDRWGYPYVLDCYRFHLSLTGDLGGVAPDVVASIRAAAQDVLDALSAEVLCFDAISVFEQARPGQDFVLRNRLVFG